MFNSMNVSEIFNLIMFRKKNTVLLIILDILTDTREGDFAHRLAIGMPEGDRNNFGVSFAFEYTKLLKKNLLYFISI